MDLKEKYGHLAMVAGASEGIGAAFSRYLAASGMDLILIARRKEPLDQLASSLSKSNNVQISTVCCDLSDPDAFRIINESAGDRETDIMVYNAALSHIGLFENSSTENNASITVTNMVTPLNMVKTFGERMLVRKKGAIILMSSLTGFHGSGFLSLYAATKAFNLVLAESLWYEWRDRGVDVLACCAGATASENYIRSNPARSGFFAPAVQTPDDVVRECFDKLGKKPSFISGRGNKLAGFFMHRLLPRKIAINIMGDNTRRIYKV